MVKECNFRSHTAEGGVLQDVMSVNEAGGAELGSLFTRNRKGIFLHKENLGTM